jgi:RNA polymerase sigma-70 factor, ECF subfamily
MVYNEEMDFEQLVLRAKNGDNGAKAILYEEYATPLYRFVYVRITDKTEADDIVQDTFIRAFSALDRYESQGKGMLPYLFTIARNLIINRAKKKKTDTIDVDFLNAHDSGDRADAEALHQDIREDLLRAMESLSDMEKEIVALRFYGEQTYTEIAEALGKREDAVRQHIARAIKKMRHALTEQAYEK